MPATNREKAEHTVGVPFSVLPREEPGDYAGLVQEFELTATTLLVRVNQMLGEARYQEEIAAGKEWREEALFLAQELRHFPWLLVHVRCPGKYDTLKLLYREWATCCGRLAHALRALATTGRARSRVVRVGLMEIEMAAVAAHNTARRIYLQTL